MKKQVSISKVEALNDFELQNTNGGYLIALAISLVVPTILCVAIYGAFMEGYNDGRAAALGN